MYKDYNMTQLTLPMETSVLNYFNRNCLYLLILELYVPGSCSTAISLSYWPALKGH